MKNLTIVKSFCLKVASIFALLFLVSQLCSCDELLKKDDNNKFVYLMTDGVTTNAKQEQTIKVMDGHRVLFEMQYTSDLKLRLLPEYTQKDNAPKIMYVGRFTKLDDIMLPANPMWSDNATIIAQGGIVASVIPEGQDEPIYLRIFIPSADYNDGKIGLQCNKIIIEKPSFGPRFEAHIENDGYFNLKDGYLNLFLLTNNYPELKISSKYSGQKESPMLTYCGQFNTIEEIELSGKWEASVPIEQNGGYYAKLETYVSGTKIVRIFVKKVSENGDIDIEYQIMTE